jgi:hypothetical protein
MPQNPVGGSSSLSISTRGDVANRYSDYHGDSSYSTDRGVLVLPIAGPDGTAPCLVKVHAEIGYRTTDVTAVKTGAPPVLPAACDTPSGDRLLGSEFMFTIPQIGPDQNTNLYRSEGRYTYVQGSLRGSGGQSNFQTVDMPYRMELIDLGVQGLIGGVVGAISGGDILSPLYYNFTNDYSGQFFTQATLR